MKKHLALYFMTLFVIFIVIIQLVLSPIASSHFTNDDKIIMNIKGGIGFTYEVKNLNNYSVTGVFNMTDSTGKRIERATFQVHPLNMVSVHVWAIFFYSLIWDNHVTATLTVENETMTRQGIKIFLLWIFY